MELKQSHLGETVLYTGFRGETIVAIITEILSGDRVNLALIPNGVAQGYVPDHATDIGYEPQHPTGTTQPNSWRLRVKP